MQISEKTGQSAAQSAVMALRDLILAGEVPAGERLFEVALAERLGVSRTPLRAAFSDLEREGLIERKQTTGYVVRRFSMADVGDAIELRGMLEGTAARFAAERGVAPAQIAEMAEILDQIDAALEGDLDLDAYSAANGAFHAALIHQARSDILRRQIETAIGLPFASPNAFLQAQRGDAAFQRSLIGGQMQHRAVLDAVARREGARAEAIMREHARLARSNLEFVMAHGGLRQTIPGLRLVVD